MKCEVYDSKTRKAISGVEIKLFDKFTTTENVILSGITLGNGMVSKEGANYGYYTASTRISGYQPLDTRFYHRSSSTT